MLEAITFAWPLHLILLTFGGAGYSICMRYVSPETNPFLYGAVYTAFGLAVHVTLVCLLVMRGEALEISTFGVLVAIFAGLSFVMIDLGFLYMYTNPAAQSASARR